MKTLTQHRLKVFWYLKLAKALYMFTSTGSGEISFEAGDIIEVIQFSDPDWWDGTSKGKTGAFPARYVERI